MSESIDAYRVAWRLELASSISGSGDGFGDLDDDCIGDVDESVAGGASNLLMMLFSNSFPLFYVLLSLDMMIYFALFTQFTYPTLPYDDVNLEDNKSL